MDSRNFGRLATTPCLVLAFCLTAAVDPAGITTGEAQAASAESSDARITQFLEANRHWLLPSLEARRGLVYEYRQEEPYLERISFDREGNILARLESTKESPARPTRQLLRLADGRSFSGAVTNTFMRLEAAQAPEPGVRNARQLDPMVQHLSMGLALDCALTRLAREPESFRAEIRSAADPKHYTLVLNPKDDARLFTGTMLAFTSWAFMHDVRYTRSEIVCDSATHRPIEEKDYAGEGELQGQYSFENWLEDPSGAAPGLIRAVVPYQKDGKDQSLEMQAQFEFSTPGLWLLKQVKSKFRGTNDGSVGTVNVMTEREPENATIRQLLAQAEATEKLLIGLDKAPDRNAEVKLEGAEWQPILLKAGWSDAALASAKSSDSRQKEAESLPVIGLYRARVVDGASDTATVELQGLSTAAWKEFRSRWQVSLQDDQGRLLATGTTNFTVRAENGPTPFLVQLELKPTVPSIPGSRQLRAEGIVERMTGVYHGHGMWMRFADQ